MSKIAACLGACNDDTAAMHDSYNGPMFKTRKANQVFRITRHLQPQSCPCLLSDPISSHSRPFRSIFRCTRIRPEDVDEKPDHPQLNSLCSVNSTARPKIVSLRSSLSSSRPVLGSGAMRLCPYTKGSLSRLASSSSPESELGCISIVASSIVHLQYP